MLSFSKCCRIVCLTVSPFWDSPDRWRKGRAHLIKGTHIYVYPYMPADKIKEEIEVLSKYFGYDPPKINWKS